MISLDLFGVPIPCSRPRFNSKTKHAYDEQARIKEGYRWQLKAQYREKPLCGAISLDLTFYMPIPKTTSKPRQRDMLNGRLHHIVKPDIDNLSKFVMDCLNGLVFEDDRCVVEIRARKLYSSKPGTLIRVSALNPEIYEKENVDNHG